MKCIICHQDMKIKMIKGVEIDICPYCGGVWLDQGEFESLSGVDPAEYRKLTCHCCKSMMVTRTIYGVEIDLCLDCGSVWLDNGELEKIIAFNIFRDHGKDTFQMFHEAAMISRDVEKIKTFGFLSGMIEPMYINDIFLVYKDGCLIAHKTRRLKPEMDDDILGAMFLVIQRFVEDSFKDEFDVELKNITFGTNQIIVERGIYTFIAAVVAGKIRTDFAQKLRESVDRIEEKFETILDNWNHKYKALRGVHTILDQLLIQ